jgi:hypothetical protein
MRPPENPMNTGRRYFLSSIAASLAGTRALLASAQSGRHQPPPQNSQGSQVPGAIGPAGPDETTLPPRADPKEQLKEDQKTLRRDVDRLLQMAKDLKDESDKTPETDVLSLSLVKKVEEIEKLAHQIKDLIRAS